ncbi:sigma-70 family RNA polymerase sigma factor [Kitasatospora sp. NBC_01287]|uniref:sigma-70 family RNA polymerase sigma factor n=1 Tax=Kitasatospora sp. NBC_01287 TaxID=2903573 RepID=UPI00225189C5|nr:sigma-70 family RNA polymerase sigma factor [Kitasatospora sp. NBC_01287]MCX4744118.1 sigma-70 family RNA polymerase sigma factor [Kitasatospora sp. NBC_01287]
MRAAVAAVATGDEPAFERFHELTAGPVLGLALKVLRDVDLAQDVAQEVMTEVWRSAARYHPDRGEVLPWVLTITHHRAVDRVRSLHAERERERRAGALLPEAAPDDVAWSVERRSEHERLRAFLGVLSPIQREAVSLTYFQGRTSTEAAALLGVPVGTVKTRLRDAIIRLRSCFGCPAPAPGGRPARRQPRPKVSGTSGPRS